MGKLRISIQIRIFMNIILNMQLRRFQRRFAAYRLEMAITDLNSQVFGNSKSLRRFTIISGSLLFSAFKIYQPVRSCKIAQNLAVLLQI